MKILILIIGLFYTIGCPAQLIRSPASASYLSIGAYSKNFTDAFSFVNNQAALAKVKALLQEFMQKTGLC